MKPKYNLFLGSLLVIAFSQAAQANPHFWDNNDVTTGFGTASGTWSSAGTGNLWSTDSTGVAAVTPDYVTTTSDALNFGTDTATFGLGAGTIAVSGAVSANSLTFGSQSGEIVLSGGTSITLGGATPTITVNNATNTISTLLAGTVGFTKAGTGIMVLSNTGNTLSGGITIGASAGTLRVSANGAASALGANAVSIGAGSTLQIDTTTNVSTVLTNVYTGTGLIRFNSAAGATALGSTFAGISGFNGTVQLANAGSTGDKFSGSIAASGVTLQIDSGSTLFSNQSTTTQTFGSIRLSGAGNNEGRGAIRLLGTLNAPVTLTGNATINVTGGTLNGAITSGAVGTQILTLGATGATTGNFNSNIGGGTGTIALTNAVGINTLNGTNSYTGATSITGGTLRAGSSTAFNNTSALSMSNTSSLNLNGFNAAFNGNITGVSTSTITNGATGAGTSTVTFTNTSATTLARITDGATAKVAVAFANNNGNQNFTNTTNTFSGGLTLLHNGTNGTRLNIAAVPIFAGTPGALTSGNYGTGTITVGEVATDRAGIFFNTANITLANAIVTNTALGNDRPGIRVDTTGNVISGAINANLSNAVFSTNTTGGIALTGQITGTSGLALHGANGTTLSVTLNNAGTANSYEGNTTINSNATVGKTMLLVLGANNQLPNGAGKGNVVINTNGTGIGTLRLQGFSDTINGLSGNGTVTTTTAGASVLTLGDGDATGLTFSGTISNTTGTVGITKIGTGTQTLSGASSYTGGTIITAGTLIAQGTTTALGATAGAADIGVNGTLQFNNNFAADNNVASVGNAITGAGTLVFTGSTAPVTAIRRLMAVGSLSGFTGNISILANGNYLADTTNDTVNQNITIASGGFLTVSSNVNAGFGVLNGGGTIMRNAGTTNAGTLTLGNNDATGGVFSGVIRGESTATNSGLFNSSGILSVIKVGSGTQTLSGANIYTGGTSIRNGSIIITGGNDRLATTSSVVLGDVATSGKLIIGDATSARNQTLAGLTATGLGGSVVGAHGTNNSLLTLSFASGTNTFAGTLGGVGTNENRLALTKSGAGTLVLSGDNSYLGNTIVSAGVLRISHGNALGFANSTTIDGNTATGRVELTGGITTGESFILASRQGAAANAAALSNLSGNNTVSGNITGITGGSTMNIESQADLLTLSGGLSQTAGTGNRTWQFMGAGNGLVSGVISNGTANLTVIKMGSGTWSFSNANTYTGNTTVTAGTLALTNNLAIQNSAFDTSGAGTLDTSTIDTPTFGGLTSATDYAISSNVTGLTLNSASGATHTYTGNLSGGATGLTLTKTGAGTQVLGGTNSYTGDTTINAGSLQIINSGALGGTNILVNSGSNGALVLGDALVAGSGKALTINGNGVGNLFGALSTATGNVGTSEWQGSVSIGSNLTRIGSQSGTLLVSGNISAASATHQLLVRNNGALTTSFSGTNDYAGGTRIVIGTLEVSGGAALHDTGLVDLDGTAGVIFRVLGSETIGALTSTNGVSPTDSRVNIGAATILSLSSGTRSYSGVIEGDGALTVNGAVQTLSGTNTYTGATSVSAGTLAVSSAGSINETSAISVAAGAQLIYNSSTALTVSPVLNGAGTSSRAVLGGTGPINVAVTLNDLGDTLAPGNSPGIQTFTPAQTWSSFSYDWELNNFITQVPGTNHDQLSLDSTLDLNGGVGAYQLNVLGLTAGNLTGAVPDFTEANQQWTILTSVGAITGFDAANWTINTSGFSNNTPFGGNFTLTSDTNNVFLNYNAIPEPSAALLAALGSLMLFRRRRTA